jgi:hypothetical protein
MKPSEYVNAWANAAAENYKDGMPIGESLVAARIVALLEAVEGSCKTNISTSANHFLVIDGWAANVLEAALALRGEK